MAERTEDAAVGDGILHGALLLVTELPERLRERPMGGNAGDPIAVLLPDAVSAKKVRGGARERKSAEDSRKRAAT